MALEKVLLLEDEEILRKNLEQQLGVRYDLASVAGLAAAQEKLSQEAFDLIITEVTLPDGTATDLLRQLPSPPGRPLVVVISAFGAVETAVECLLQGAFAYVLKPFSSHHLEAVLEKTEAFARLSKVSRHLSRGSVADSTSEQLGRSPAMAQLRTQLRQVAQTQATVLIQGETGVGKELAARVLFEQSPRSAGPFIRVDCTALADDLLHEELFGLGAAVSPGTTRKREGCFELAQGGTILLDEIAVISPALQAKLLDLLQKQELPRGPGKPPLPLDARLIATTNRLLQEKVKRGEFREDLFLALNIVPVMVPPLRERKEDIPLLAEHFRQRFVRQLGLETLAISPSCLSALQQYSWPGNVRELQNAVQRAMLLAGSGGVLQPEHFGLAAPALGPGVSTASVESAEADSIAEMERKHIFAVLEKYHGNRTHAATRLGISIRTLRNKLRSYKSE